MWSLQGNISGSCDEPETHREPGRVHGILEVHVLFTQSALTLISTPSDLATSAPCVSSFTGAGCQVLTPPHGIELPAPGRLTRCCSSASTHPVLPPTGPPGFLPRAPAHLCWERPLPFPLSSPPYKQMETQTAFSPKCSVPGIKIATGNIY